MIPLDANGDPLFDYSQMCEFKKCPKRAPEDRFKHEGPWTRAGKELQQRDDEEMRVDGPTSKEH
ncbi:hypothetical protein FRC08_011001 [Ceratobasidium sp. 394]|nr:hypothetical protein FRC08_011001 [Ceratobasidium sp. 394]